MNVNLFSCGLFYYLQEKNINLIFLKDLIFQFFFLKFIISVSFISGLSEGNEKFLRESSLSFFLETKFLNRLNPFSWKQKQNKNWLSDIKKNNTHTRYLRKGCFWIESEKKVNIEETIYFLTIFSESTFPLKKY